MEYTKSKYTALALKYSKKYNLKIEGDFGHNCETDAFRHAFTSASISLKTSENITENLGNWYEKHYDSKQPKNEENMDLWNNQQGREIAKEIKKQCPFWKEVDEESLNDLIAAKVMQRMRHGKLITTPDDKRKFTGFAANIEEDDDLSNTKGDWLERALNPPKKKYYNVIDDRTFSWYKDASTYMAEHYPELKEYKILSDYYNADGHWVTINGNHVYIED